MAKRKSKKVKTAIYKKLHGKLKIDLLKTDGELRCSGRICSSYSTSGTRRVTLDTNPVIKKKVMNGERIGKCLRQVY